MSSGKSGVYLVSSSPRNDNSYGMGGNSDVKKEHSYDNPGFKSLDKDEVKFSTANGLEMPADNTRPAKPYRGMGKDDLLYFSSQPFWRRLRMACIAFIGLGWLALVITVVALVLIYPRCRDPAPRSWWQTEVTYRIYVPSFMDSDGDGVGDLNGIKSKLDYLKDLGVGVISLSSIYQTPRAVATDTVDTAISNHMAVQTEYGTMADFEALVEAVHEKGMFLVLDFIPNHTSDQHHWFIESISTSDRSNQYRNFYVWENGNDTTPPNNWLSVYDEQAWGYNDTRQQVYLHHFNAFIPDLNLRSTLVQEHLEEILQFWLDKGADGFNIRDTSFLFEDYDLRNDIQNQPGDKYADFNHTYSQNQPEMYDIVARWRAMLEDALGGEKLLMADTTYVTDVSRLYGKYGNGAQMPLNTRFLSTQMTCDGQCIASFVNDWRQTAGTGWSNWVVGDEDSDRIGTRFNSSYIRAFTMLTMLLPGSPVLYYGDEIGMKNGNQAPNQWQQGQDMRTPMQWENSTDGGFVYCNISSCSSPWLALNDDYDTVNVQAATADQGSLLNFIKDLVALRKKPSFQHGEFSTAVIDQAIYSFVTEFDGESGYLVAINFGPTSETRDYRAAHSSIQSQTTVALALGDDYSVEDEVSPNEVGLSPYSGVVLSWDYVAKEL